MKIIIRKAEVKDALCIVEAEREIAQEPGYFCSEPSELNERVVMDLLHKQNNPKLERQDIAIRLMQEGDMNTLIKIFCFPWSSVEDTRDKWLQYYKEHQEQIRTVYLLEKQEHILGYASLLRQSHYPNFKDNDIPEINDVWISAEHRGNGLGRSLVQYLEKMAHRENYRQIGIGVGLYKDYGRAQRLYIHLGYVPDGMGVTYKSQPVVPGDSYPVDDDLLIWLKKDL